MPAVRWRGNRCRRGVPTIPDWPCAWQRAGPHVMESCRLPPPAVQITASRSRAPTTTEAYNGIRCGGGRCAQEEDRVGAPNRPITYIVPDEGWAPLLEIIVREAPSGSVIEVNTGGMQALAERMLQRVSQCCPPPRCSLPPPLPR